MRPLIAAALVLIPAVAAAADPAPVKLGIVDKLCVMVVKGRPKLESYITEVGGKVTVTEPGHVSGPIPDPTFESMSVREGYVNVIPPPRAMPSLDRIRAAWPKEKLVPAGPPRSSGLFHILLERPAGKGKTCHVDLEAFTGKGIDDAGLGGITITR